MPITDPTDIANLRWWLDASDTGSFTFYSSTNVQFWNDLSGNGTTFRDFAGPTNPVTRTGSQNGLPTVICNAPATGGEDSGISESQPISIFMVVRVAQTTWAGIFSGTGLQVRRSGAVPANILFHAGGTEASHACNSTDYHLIGAIFNGASSSQRIDKVQVGTTNTGAGGMTRMIGGLDNGNTNANPGVQWAEVVVYTSAISGADLTDIEDYLYDKWFGAAPEPDLEIPQLHPPAQANVYRM